MTIQHAIERAIEGGWDPKQDDLGYSFARLSIGTDIREGNLWLDPTFWQALGKAEGWGTYDKNELTYSGNRVIGEVALLNMHCMIDALWVGKSLESFIETL